MSWGIVAVAGATLVGGAMGANASKGAAKDQAASAANATAAEKEARDQQIELQAPWREAGGLGLNKLSYLLGLSPGGTFTPGSTMDIVGGQPGGQSATAETRDQILARLSPQYLTQTPGDAPALGGGAEGQGGGMIAPDPAPLVTRLDEVALNAAVDAEFAKQQQAAKTQQTTTNALATASATKDPQYGSLLRNFGMQDFQTDPGYGFRLSEGQKALDRASAASGRFNSGRAAKDLTRFGQNLASEEYGNAYNRFNNNQSNTFNRLASLAGIGQTATNQVGNAAGQFGSAAAGNAIGAGNAAAAGRVGSANAWGGAIGQVGSMYQQNSLMNSLRSPTYGGGGMTGGGGFGTGAMFGNQDYGQYL
jgi:hypothetical protein